MDAAVRDAGPRLTQGVAAGASGVYVTGMTVKVPNEAGATEWDGFVRKYDRDGNEMWARQFGTPGWDDPRGVAIGASGVYVAGDTNGTFPGQSNAGEWDGFVRAYDHSGNELWTRQFGTVHRDHPLGVAVGVAGVYVAGVTWGTFPGETSASEGIRDGFLRIYDHDGNELATRQFGTPDPDVAQGVAVTPSGVYVAGRTDGTFPGETNAGGSDVFVAKFNVSVDLPLVERPRFVFSPFATAAILASSVVVVAVIVAIDRRKTKGRGRI